MALIPIDEPVKRRLVPIDEPALGKSLVGQLAQPFIDAGAQTLRALQKGGEATQQMAAGGFEQAKLSANGITKWQPVTTGQPSIPRSDVERLGAEVGQGLKVKWPAAPDTPDTPVLKSGLGSLPTPPVERGTLDRSLEKFTESGKNVAQGIGKLGGARTPEGINQIVSGGLKAIPNFAAGIAIPIADTIARKFPKFNEAANQFGEKSLLPIKDILTSPEVMGNPTDPVQAVVQGALKSALGTAQDFSKPVMLASLAASAMGGPAVAQTIGAVFLADMAQQAPEMIQQIGEGATDIYHARTPAELAQAVEKTGNPVVGMYFLGSLAKHGLSAGGKPAPDFTPTDARSAMQDMRTDRRLREIGERAPIVQTGEQRQQAVAQQKIGESKAKIQAEQERTQALERERGDIGEQQAVNPAALSAQAIEQQLGAAEAANKSPQAAEALKQRLAAEAAQPAPQTELAPQSIGAQLGKHLDELTERLAKLEKPAEQAKPTVAPEQLPPKMSPAGDILPKPIEGEPAGTGTEQKQPVPQPAPSAEVAPKPPTLAPVTPEPPVKPTEAPAPVVERKPVSAAYKDPKTKEWIAGKDHTAILEKLGRKVPLDRTDKRFGFLDAEGQPMTREEAGAAIEKYDKQGNPIPARAHEVNKFNRAERAAAAPFKIKKSAELPFLLQKIIDMGGIKGKGKGKVGDPLYDDQPELTNIGHRRVFGGKLSPDEVATALELEGLLPPGSDTKELYRAIENASKVWKSEKALEALEAKYEEGLAYREAKEKAKAEEVHKLEEVEPVEGGDVSFDPAEFEPKPAAEPLTLESPTAEQLRTEELAREQKEKIADGQAKPLKGDAGDIEQTDPLTQSPSLFAEGKPKLTEQTKGLGGAATPEEFVGRKDTATGIKNAKIDEERAARGLEPMMQPERLANKTVWDRVMAKIDNDPAWQDRLISELKEKPRTPDQDEIIALDHRYADLQNEYAKATRELASTYEDVAAGRTEREHAYVEAKIRVAEWQDKLQEIEEVSKAVGTEWGRSGQMRQRLLREDFSLAAMTRNKRAALGGRELTPAETVEIQRLKDQLDAANKKYDDYFKQAQDKIRRLEISKLIERTKASRGEVTPEAGHKRTIENIKRDAGEGRPVSEMGNFIRQLAEQFVREGIITREPLIDAVHGVLKEIVPDIERRETMDAISGYGDFKQLSKDEVKVKLRDLKGQMQQIGKLEDMAAGQPPKKTGVERREPSMAEKELIKLVNAEKERGGYKVTDPEKQLKSALASYKTRLNTQIANLADKLEREDFTTTPKRRIELDPEASRLKAETERLKQQFRQGVARDKLKQRSTTEKVMDTYVKWRRAFILSSPITLAKLTSAAAERMTFTPLEELIGAGIGKVTGLSKGAPRQGGFNVRAEARAITEGFTSGMKDSWDVLRTGKSQLDLLYGKPEVVPHSAIEFVGNLHGALKAQAKRNEFTRSFEKRIANAIEHGVDASDPLVQMRTAIDAYKDANRSIFMQDNLLVDAYKRGLTTLEQKNKATGKVPLWSKALATTARTLLPIVKVPTNIVGETLEYAVGSVTGSVRLARAIKEGYKNVSPEEKDVILRQLKKGSLGAAMLLLGYANPDSVGGYYQPGKKRDPKDVKAGALRVRGVDVPTYVVHNPFLELLQIGATISRVAKSFLHKKDTEQEGLGAGTLAAAIGLFEEVPFVREPFDLQKITDPRQDTKVAGGLAKSLVVPQGVEWAARYFDTDAKGETIRRGPRTVMENIKTGIPGLRQKVPVKIEKKSLAELYQ